LGGGNTKSMLWPAGKLLDMNHHLIRQREEFVEKYFGSRNFITVSFWKISLLETRNIASQNHTPSKKKGLSVLNGENGTNGKVSAQFASSSTFSLCLIKLSYDHVSAFFSTPQHISTMANTLQEKWFWWSEFHHSFYTIIFKKLPHENKLVAFSKQVATPPLYAWIWVIAFIRRWNRSRVFFDIFDRSFSSHQRWIYA